MTDNTQEPDYTHPDEMPIVEQRPNPHSDLRGMIVHFTSEMLDNPNDYGIYPTTNFYSDLEEAIINWHNSECLALLEELEKERVQVLGELKGTNIFNSKREDILAVPLSAIQKAKERYNGNVSI